MNGWVLFAGGSIVGMLVGVGLGYSIASGPVNMDNPPLVAAGEATEPPRAPGGINQANRPVSIVRAPVALGDRSGAGIHTTKPDDPLGLAKDNVQLRGQVKDLERKVAELDRSLDFERGKPIAFPAGLDEKYLEKGLLDTINRAFDEVGVDGDVTFVDCDEYPCIVCGQVGGNGGEKLDVNEQIASFEKVSKSEALSVYKDDKKHGSVFARREKGDGGEFVHQTQFCQSVYPDPKDEQSEQAIQQRINQRVRKIQDGL